MQEIPFRGGGSGGWLLPGQAAGAAIHTRQAPLEELHREIRDCVWSLPFSIPASATLIRLHHVRQGTLLAL